MTATYAEFRRSNLTRPLRSVLHMGSEAFAVKMAVAVVMGLVIHQPPREFESWPLEDQFILAVVAAPLVETVKFQLLPILLVRALGGRQRLPLALSVVLFTLAHVSAGPITTVSAAVGGLYYGSLFLRWLERSVWTAYWTAALCHALVNALATSLMALAICYVHLSAG